MLMRACTRPSDSVKAIADALRELSKRVGERKGDKVVCKIMWDRGSFKQLYRCVHPPACSGCDLGLFLRRNHVDVSPATWIGLHLPAPSDVPHLSLQVIVMLLPSSPSYQSDDSACCRTSIVRCSVRYLTGPRSVAAHSPSSQAPFTKRLLSSIEESLFSTATTYRYVGLSLPSLASPKPFGAGSPQHRDDVAPRRACRRLYLRRFAVVVSQLQLLRYIHAHPRRLQLARTLLARPPLRQLSFSLRRPHRFSLHLLGLQPLPRAYRRRQGRQSGSATSRSAAERRTRSSGPAHRCKCCWCSAVVEARRRRRCTTARRVRKSRDQDGGQGSRGTAGVGEGTASRSSESKELDGGA